MNNTKVSFEALLAFACLEADAQELRETPSLKELSERYAPSDAFLKKMSQTIKKTQAQLKRKQRLKSVGKVLVSCSLSLSVITCFFLPTHAVQTAIVDTIITWREQFVQFAFTSESENVILPETITIEYLPNGYTVITECMQNDEFYKISYQNEQKDTISIWVHAVNSGAEKFWSIDNESTQYYTVIFSDKEALWGHREDGGNVLMWSTDSYSFLIIADESLEELIKISEKIFF